MISGLENSAALAEVLDEIRDELRAIRGLLETGGARALDKDTTGSSTISQGASLSSHELRHVTKDPVFETEAKDEERLAELPPEQVEGTEGKFDLSMDQLEDIFGEAGGSGPRST